LILDLKTHSLARELEVHDSITSTNQRAKERAKGNANDGLCIVAQSQTFGKGQRNRQWASPHRAGLYVSFLIRPEISPSKTPLFTLASAVAVADAVYEVAGVKAGIKWPNDLLDSANLKKFSGILVEASSSADQLAYAIIGIGINLCAAALPSELHDYATALDAMSGRVIEPEAMLSALANQLEPRLEAIIEGDIESILSDWQERALGLGQRVEFFDDDQRIEGELNGIIDDGALVIDGSCYYSGELRLPGAPWRPEDSRDD
jgi:BirA family biotin operon repressor/biotin-[acetyl-CoA-carboxylase] ligase